MATGKVTQVIGTVVDVEFPPDEMPQIYSALEAQVGGKRLMLEVEQHVGNNWVRCLALGPTDGLARGVEAVDTGRTACRHFWDNSYVHVLSLSSQTIIKSTPPR